jgi:hypothetical protein
VLVANINLINLPLSVLIARQESTLLNLQVLPMVHLDQQRASNVWLGSMRIKKVLYTVRNVMLTSTRLTAVRLSAWLALREK